MYFIEISLVIITIGLSLYWYMTRKFSHFTNKKMPFIKPLPFFGNAVKALTMSQNLGDMLADLYRKTTNPYVGFFILDEPCVLIRDATLIKSVLIKDFQFFQDRIACDNKKDDPVGTNVLFVLKNPAWRRIRAKMSPAFSSGKIKAMAQFSEECANEMVDHLKTQDDSLVEFQEITSKFSLNVIGSTYFGVNVNSFKGEGEFTKAVRKIVDWNDFFRAIQMRCYFLAPTLVKLFHMKFLAPNSIKYLRESFFDIMQQRVKSATVRNDLIDILIELRKTDATFLDDDQMIAQPIQIIVAGFETTAETIAFCLYELAQNSEIQNKLRKEILQADALSYDALNEMSYLDLCIKETLRKYPVLPFLDRRCNTAYTIPGTDQIIDAGTPVFISLMGLHYDPDFFPDPEVFNPDRFLESKYEAYIPFGDGPRSCIGNRVGLSSSKWGVASIVKNFRLEVSNKTDQPIKFQPNGILLAAANGIVLKMTAIN